MLGNTPEVLTLRVVDPHIHLWDLSTGLYPLRAARGSVKTAMSGDYLLEDLLADTGPVEIVKGVHVEAFPTDGLLEAKHVQVMADKTVTGIAQGIVAYADLSQPDVGAALKALSTVPNVRGIRQVIDRWVPRPGTSERDLLTDSDWWRGFGLLHQHGLTFDMQARPDQHAEAASRLADYPEPMVVLDHIGAFADRTFSNWKIWRKGLRTLASRPNTWVKISGAGMYDDTPTVESVRPCVYEALEAFGWERAMFASNFPVDKRAIGYAELWTIFVETIKDLPAEQRDALMRGNAERFYRI